MDIIFQSGEFFNEASFFSTLLEPLATLIGVIVSALFGIYLFNKGIEKDRELAREQRDKDYAYNRRLEEERRKTDLSIKEDERISSLQKFGSLFIELLKGCVTTATKQSAAYKEYSEEFLKDLLGQHFPKLYPHENLQRLLSLDIEKVLSFFELKKSSNKDFINTIAQLDYLSVVFTRIPKDIFEGNGKTVIELSNKVLSIRNKILGISTEYINIQKRDNKDYENDPLYSHLNNMVKDYLTDYDGKPSIARDYDMLFLIIKDKLLEEPFRYQTICNDLLNLAKEGSDVIFSVKQFNEQQSKDIITALEKINESIAKLEDILKKLM